jgi:hypothetical protein
VFVLVKRGECDDLRIRIMNLAVDADLEKGECICLRSSILRKYDDGRRNDAL